MPNKSSQCMLAEWGWLIFLVRKRLNSCAFYLTEEFVIDVYQPRNSSPPPLDTHSQMNKRGKGCNLTKEWHNPTHSEVVQAH